MREEVEERNRKMLRTMAMWSNATFVRAFQWWAATAAQGRKTQELQRRILLRMQHGCVWLCFSAWCELYQAEVRLRTHRTVSPGL